MKTFRFILTALLLAIPAYTLVVISNEGFSYLPAYIDGIMRFGWTGQFHVDFAAYLLLGALWIAWRHNFSAMGWVFGVLSFLMGMSFVAAYLLYQARGDDMTVQKLVLGDRHTALN